MAGRILSLISTAEQVDTFKTDESEVPTSRFGVFKAAMTGKDKYGKGKLFKIMILSLIGAAGAGLGIFLFLNMSANNAVLGQDPRFSSNYLGYPFSIGAGKVFAQQVLDAKFMFYALLVPSLLIFGVALSGLFYVAKRWAYLEHDANISRMFLRGVLKNAINFLVIFLLLGGVLFLFNFALKGITEAQINSGNNFGLVFATVCLCIFLGFYLIMTMYMCTLSVTYKMNIFIVIKNAALLTVGSLGLVLRNILIGTLCVAPIALFWIPGVGIIGLLFFALYGIMLSIIVFTVYSHWVFEKVGLSNNPSSYAYVAADAANAGTAVKKAGIIESEVKPESVETPEPAAEKPFSPTSNAQTQNKKSGQNHSKKKKKKH